MTYSEAIFWLQGLGRFGLRPGLETTRQLAAAAGDPQRRLRFVHVAGTNGKGSTCAFLESVYRHAGRRVGLYTSPHLVTFRERLQLDRALIPEADLARLATAARGRIEAGTTDGPATLFEVATVMALEWFAEQQADLVIWETGLGGRLDATNIVTPLASVITNIGWDHMDVLGDSLAKIAAEKAGIIKPGVPVVTGAEGPALEVIRAAAARQRVPLRIVHEGDADLAFAAQAGVSLAGRHQVRNAALAVATVRVLADVLPVSEAALGAGLRGTEWPGRFQLLRRGAQRLLLDGAHNAPGAAALAAALERQFPGERPALIAGMLADKQLVEMVRRLAGRVRRVVVVPVASARSAPIETLATEFRQAAPDLPVSLAASVPEALGQTAAEPFVLLTGSLYLVGEALERLTGGGAGEQALNEWRPAAGR
jgi:dihydrofolate synthase/folylpolyglutamate synthase